MGLTANICEVVASLPGPRHDPCWDHPTSPVLLQVPLGTPKAPWEVQWDHRDLPDQHFWETLAAGCASKPPLNEWVEASGSHGHLSLANHPWSSLASVSRSRGSVCFVAAGWLACGSQSRAVLHIWLVVKWEKVEELLCTRVWP